MPVFFSLQELRVQFAGAVPLSRQEKFSRQMMQLQQDKQKLEIELKQVGHIVYSVVNSFIYTERKSWSMWSAVNREKHWVLSSKDVWNELFASKW